MKKVICPAPSKCATVSMTRALESLGLRIAHYPHGPEVMEALRTGKAPLSLLEHYDGITDLPASIWWKDFAKHYDCVFIMMIRPEIEWIDSMKRYYSKMGYEKGPISIHHLLRMKMWGAYGVAQDLWKQRMKQLLLDYGEKCSIAEAASGIFFSMPGIVPQAVPYMALDTRDSDSHKMARIIEFLKSHDIIHSAPTGAVFPRENVSEKTK